MRTGRIVVLCIFFLSVISPWAAAQKRPPHLELFAEGGASILNSGSSANLPVCLIACTPAGCPPCTVPTVTGAFTKTGRLVAGARWRFARHDALEASYSFSPNHLSLQRGTATQSDAYNRVDLVSFNFVHYLWAKTPIQPFATAGLGLNRFSGPPLFSTLINSPSTISTNTNNGFQFAWNFGGGTDIVFQRHLAVRLELRDYVTGQPGLISGTSHNLVPSAGLVFRFM